jgi:hypothetical protein
VYSTDLAVTWTRQVPRAGGTEMFFRAVTMNIFNRGARTRGDIAILTRVNDARYQAFNPFTTTPARGVHWEYSPTFGEPQAFDDYQDPREFSFSVGVRF